MTAPEDPSDVLRFGPFQLAIARRKLFFAKDEVHLGGRAMDVLMALALRKGELLSKEDLLSAAWPNIFVHEGNLKVTVAALRRALREYAPTLELINTVVGRGYWLSADNAIKDETDVDMVGVSGVPLPELGTVIGRDKDIAQLRATLATNRLTTVAGAGGIGKTTVAIAAAQLFEDEDGAAVTFVDLSRVASEEFVTVSLAAALGISSESGDTLQAIIAILARRKSLLVFDTCEHVLPAVSHVCDILLEKTKEVRILATSRAVLGVKLETVMWLAPLDVPPVDHAETIDDVLSYSAPQLLAARALESSGYSPGNQDAKVIAEICRRLDGAPLAIELVSSRLAGRSADLVLKELDDRFRTLRSNRPGAPLRQQTLLITLEWSYALLGRAEAATLRAVSIFAGSFDIDAAARVVEHHGLTPSDAADAIAGLRSKSMLSLDHAGGDLRYRLLDSTRAFASDLLDNLGEVDAVSANHAKLQLKIFMRACIEQATMSARNWRATYGGLVDDLRKALDWSLYRGGDPLLGVQLAAAGLPLWQELSMGDEARRNCEHAIAEFDRIGCIDKGLKLRLVVGLASLNAYLTTDVAKIIALFETARQLARETNNVEAECLALSAVATFSLLPGQDETVSGTLDELRETALQANDRPALWEQEKLRAWLEVYLCRFDAANRRLIGLRADMKDHIRGAAPRFHVDQKSSIDIQYGALQWLMGKPGHAVEAIEEAARDAIDLGHGLSLVHALTRGVIFVFLECHHYDQARRYANLLKSVILQHGMATWLPLSDCYSESIEALSGARRSPERLRAVLHDLQGGTAQLANNTYCSTLARAMLAIGKPADAALAVDYIHQMGAQRWNMPEILRVQVAIDRARGCDDNAKAEATLRESLRLAEDIGCLAWSLRTGNDLATLLREEGRLQDARSVLLPVYQRFTDGFDSGDVRKASLLLKQLD